MGPSPVNQYVWSPCKDFEFLSLVDELLSDLALSISSSLQTYLPFPKHNVLFYTFVNLLLLIPMPKFPVLCHASNI